MKFSTLIQTIQQTHSSLHLHTLKAVNRALTLRNWLTGYYIVEFEQKGEDRAVYGERLLAELSKSLHIKGLSETTLKLNRLFYNIYPQIGQELHVQLDKMGIRQSVTDEFGISKIGQTLTDESFKRQIREDGILQPLVPAERIISQLSFTHITELLPIGDPLKRAFYEIECIKGTWSVRELKGKSTACTLSGAG